MTKSERKRFSLCPRCLEFKPLTVHHARPKRFYGDNIYRVSLCRGCHDLLEEIISKLELDRGGRLKDSEYLDLTKKFVKGGCDV